MFLAVQTRVWDSSLPTPVPHWVQGAFTFWHTEWPLSLVAFETFEQSDEETWPDQNKHTDKDKYKDKDNDKDKYI